MSLSEQAIKEFRDIYRREFGERIPEKEAREMAEDLLLLFEMIYRPIPDTGEQSIKPENKKP